MCQYCSDYKKNVLAFAGTDFELNKTSGYKEEYMKYRCWIMKGKKDEKAGIMISEGGGNAVYADINYCPMCRKEVR